MVGGYLWKLTSAGTVHISVAADLCKRARFRGSVCRRCEEICSENAISLDRGLSIANSCSDCGLCQVACPTEVFQHELRTDHYLLNQAADLLGRDGAPGEKRRLVVQCHEAEDRGENALSLACLGRINENIILGAALLGFEEITLLPGCCSECHLRQGERLYRNSIRSARLLLRAVGLDAVTVDIGGGERGGAGTLERRDVLKNFAGTIRDRVAAYVYFKETAIRRKLASNLEGQEVTRLPSRKSILLGLLRRRPWREEIVVEYEEESPWGAVEIDWTRCSACGICASLCPTGALFDESEDGWYTLYCRNLECCNCSLCVEACPENAIGFEQWFSFESIMIETKPRVAVRVEVGWCAVCGGEKRVGGSKLCSTCERRRIRPQTLKM